MLLLPWQGLPGSQGATGEPGKAGEQVSVSSSGRNVVYITYQAWRLFVFYFCIKYRPNIKILEPTREYLAL